MRHLGPRLDREAAARGARADRITDMPKPLLLQVLRQELRLPEKASERRIWKAVEAERLRFLAAQWADGTRGLVAWYDTASPQPTPEDIADAYEWWRNFRELVLEPAAGSA